jgi:uncharacterized protein involved in exopolysaccharide biosynthesis
MSALDVQVGWQDYLAIALRRKAFFLAPFGLALAIGAVVAIVAPRLYHTYALVIVKNDTLINPLIQDLAVPTDIDDRMETLREEILSWSNLAQLIERHRLDEKLPPNNPAAYDKLVRRLRKSIGVKLSGENLVSVGYIGREPRKVQEVVNSLADIVIEREAAIRHEETETAVKFIEAEMDIYRGKLEASEQRLREFKELHMTEMPVVTSLNERLTGLQLELSNLLITNTELHPRVVEVKRQIEDVRAARDAEIQKLVAKGVFKEQDPELQQELMARLTDESSAAQDPALAKARDTMQAVVESLEQPEVPAAGPQIAVSAEGATVQLSDAAAASLTLSPRQQQELARLMRDYEVNDTLYQGLLEKLERARITGRLGGDEEGGKFVILERARLPLRPVKPNLLQLLIFSLMAGIALGMAAVVIAEYLDRSLQNDEEAEQVLGVPVLGSISTIVTEADLQARRERRKRWLSWREYAEHLKTYVLRPAWSRIDRALVRWGL